MDRFVLRRHGPFWMRASLSSQLFVSALVSTIPISTNVSKKTFSGLQERLLNGRLTMAVPTSHPLYVGSHQE
jgi:hypothetical protein